jgi:RecJ-like exonuclease
VGSNPTAPTKSVLNRFHLLRWSNMICPKCDGSGQWFVMRCVCPTCRGTGEVCPLCANTGKVDAYTVLERPHNGTAMVEKTTERCATCESKD